MRRGEETIMPNWALDAIEGMTLATDIRVFNRLVRFRQYRENHFSTKQLAIALEVDTRTIRESTERLRLTGLCLSYEGLHCSPGATSKLPASQIRAAAFATEKTREAEGKAQDICKTPAKTLQKDPAPGGDNSVQDRLKSSLNKGSKEERNKEVKNNSPLQGEAREDAAPGSDSELIHDPAQASSPSGEAAYAANKTGNHSRVDQKRQTGRKKPAASSKKVPAARRAAESGPPAQPGPTPFQELFGAVALACYGGHDELTNTARSRVAAAVKSLNKAGYTAADIPLIVAWLHKTQSWRSEMTPQVIEERAPAWRGAQRGSLRQREHVVKFTPRPRTTEEANQRFLAQMAANGEALRGIFDD